MSSPGTDQRPSVMSKVVNNRPRPVVLCILDGWGLREARENNALAQARLPNWTRLMRTRPWPRIGTSGTDVGLPAGQMEAAQSLGLSRVLAYRKVILPQAIAIGLRPLGNELILMIKSSAIASVITVYDLMGVTRLAFSRSYDMEVYLWAAVLYLLMVEIVRRVWDVLERRLNRHHMVSR